MNTVRAMAQRLAAKASLGPRGQRFLRWGHSCTYSHPWIVATAGLTVIGCIGLCAPDHDDYREFRIQDEMKRFDTVPLKTSWPDDPYTRRRLPEKRVELNR
mmetsp:Transcript_1109/g.1229  ORF Transcript_1109/g.1229 Transcript_1109/m.1229 type:complete len:101 (-) Transcript_1109:21-323(-)